MSKSSSMFSGTRPQVIAALTATISAISDGMHYGWTAPVIPILNSDSSPVVITKSDENWLESIYLIGGIAGLPCTIYLVNKVGRKNSTIIASVTSLISWILIAVASTVEVLLVARFLSGLAGDVAFVATPMYVAEIADQKIRGFLSSLIYLMMLFGILLIYVVAPFLPFFVPSLVGGVLLSLQLVLAIKYMPKSPHYLISKNKLEKARVALNRLRTGSQNEQELSSIAQSIERERKDKGRPLDLLTVASNRKALIIVCGLNGFQHFCGISVMLMNLHTILSAAKSIYMQASTSAIVFSSIMLAAATFASFNIDKYGRKFLLVTSSICTGICLLILAIYFHLQILKYDLTSVSWIPVVCVMIYAAGFKLGLGMVPIVVSAEMFSNNIKALGMSSADIMYLVFGILSIEFYKQMVELFGFHVPLYVFALCALVAAVFNATYVIETKGRTLEEIQMLLKGEPLEVTTSNAETGNKDPLLNKTTNTL